MVNTSNTKQCTKCGEIKDVSNFHLKRGKPKSTCVDCDRAKYKLYYKNNKEKVNAKNKKWGVDNKEKRQEYFKNYRIENKEYIAEWHKNNRSTNPEKYRAWAKAYVENHKDRVVSYRNEWTKNNRDKVNKQARKRYAKNKDHILKLQRDRRNSNGDAYREYQKKWRQSHSENVAAYLSKYQKNNKDKHCAKQHRRRFRLVENGGSYTAKEWKELCEKYGNKCLACGKTGVKLTVDHVVSLKHKGKNTIDNLQPLCASCNSSKGAREIDYR